MTTEGSFFVIPDNHHPTLALPFLCLQTGKTSHPCPQEHRPYISAAVGFNGAENHCHQHMGDRHCSETSLGMVTVHSGWKSNNPHRPEYAYLQPPGAAGHPRQGLGGGVSGLTKGFWDKSRGSEQSCPGEHYLPAEPWVSPAASSPILREALGMTGMWR